jgi:hypothetical protein
MFVLQLVSTAVLLVTLTFVGRQVAEGRRAAYATAFGVVVGILQSQEIRNARGHVLNNLGPRETKNWSGHKVLWPSKEFSKWDERDRNLAASVCQSYDTAAIMCRRGMLPPDVVADSWGDSLRKIWPIVKPLIDEYQISRAPEYWDDFVWMAELAHSQPWKHQKRWRRKIRVKLGDWVGGSDRPR